MAVYRYYIFKDLGDVAAPAVRMDFPNDDAAIAHAKTIIDGHPIEIWHRNRKVGRIDPAAADCET